MVWSGYPWLGKVFGSVRPSHWGLLSKRLGLALMCASVTAAANSAGNDRAAGSGKPLAEQWVTNINEHWSTELRSHTSASVRAFHIPLGAMKKIGGIWRAESSEIISGKRRRLTWQVEGEPVLALFNDLALTMGESATLRWHCEGRACGNGAEWANKVYQERLLYGRDEFMAYRAFQLESGMWVTLFSAARTADRQYLHVDIIEPIPEQR